MNSWIIYILKHYWCLNWALVWCQRILNKVFTNSIFNWEENKSSPPLMILISISFIITSANIQQLRWHQDKFYLITIKEMVEKVIINIEKSRKIFIKKFITMLEILYYCIRRCFVPPKRPTFSKIREGTRQRWFFIFQNLSKIFKILHFFYQKSNWRVVLLIRYHI